MRPGERSSLDKWQHYRKSLLSDSGVDLSISEAERMKHRTYLEAHPLEWMKFFFPKYASSEFAPFHVRFINRVLGAPEWYEVVSWSRELAKDTVAMFVLLYLVLTGQKKFIVLVSSGEDAAIELLMPYMLNLESNQRLIAYYGQQKNYGDWEEGNFSTQGGAKFIALGAGQSPRGKKNEEVRPDCIIATDLDTDEDVRNITTAKKKFDWFEQALLPTRSISKPLLVLILGNIIAKTCCVTLAAQKADKHDVVNIRDKNGKSTWPAKNTEEMIDRVLSKISTKSAQQEYYNNPLSEGDTFKEITWGKCPQLSSLPYAVVYADPATSNKDKQKSGGSYKSVFLVGYKDSKFYIYNGFLDQVPNAEFVGWFYAIRDYVSKKTQLYNYIENNTLQDPFFEQVFIPLFAALGKERGLIGIVPDSRKKPDKFVRIEGNLEPLNRNGQLIFNIDERDNLNMQRLEEQFLLLNPQLKSPADGPDCIEGAVYILNEKRARLSSDSLVIGKNKINSKRY
jgi:hypothetical protein